jgi:hypothetical protein
MSKYDWLASNSGPRGCPMELTGGDFFFPDGGSLYVPPTMLHLGWGIASSLHVVGDDTKPLPNRLQITFYSYLEDKFYQGDFKLPYDRIAELFAAGYPARRGKTPHITFDTIVAGVAPGGAVSVWLSGIERQVEVFSGLAQEVELDWHAQIGMPPAEDRQKVREETLVDAATRDALVPKMRQKLPLGAWEGAYRARYDWHPVFEGMPEPDYIEEFKYFNGEREAIEMPIEEAAKHTLRAVPSYVWVVIRPPGRVYELTLDEDETLSTFERLAERGQPLELVFSTEQVAGGGIFRILVRSRDESVPLKKADLKFWAAD